MYMYYILAALYLNLCTQVSFHQLAPQTYFATAEARDNAFSNEVYNLLQDETKTDFSNDDLAILMLILQQASPVQRFSFCMQILALNRSNGTYLVQAILKQKNKIFNTNYISEIMSSKKDRRNENTSLFFSNILPLEWIRDQILNLIKTQNYSPQNKVKILSIGASRFQEALSVLIYLILDYEKDPSSWPYHPLSVIEFIAIEKDLDVIRDAQKGRYSNLDTRNIIDFPWFERFFKKIDPASDDHTHQIDPLLTYLIRPIHASFFDVKLEQNFDIALFNGISLYLDENKRHEAAQKIQTWLKPNGHVATTAPIKYFESEGFKVTHTHFHGFSHVLEAPTKSLSLETEILKAA